MESKIAAVIKYFLTTLSKQIRAILPQKSPVDSLFQSDSDRRKAIDTLENKLIVFHEQIRNFAFPIKSVFFLERWDELKDTTPALAASVAYAGRKHAGSILPEIPIDVSDSEPLWGNCDFEMITEAEKLFNACRQDLRELFCSEVNNPKVLDRLERRSLKFEATSAYDDIRRIYWLLRVEIFLSIRFRQPELAWDIYKQYFFGEDYRFWIELRSKDLPILSHLQDQSIPVYENDGKAFREETLNMAREHYRNLPENNGSKNYGDGDNLESTPRSQPVIKEQHLLLGQSEDSSEIKSQPEVSTEDPYQFFRVGEYWDLVWQGKRIRIKHMNGFLYIHQLLSNPRTPISVVVMDSAASSRPTDNTIGDTMITQYQKSNKLGSYPSDDIDIEFAMREQKGLQNALEIAVEELNQLEQLPDTAPNAKRRSDLELAISSAKESLLDFTNPKKKIREVKEPMFEKARNNVRKGMDRAIKKIGKRKYLPEMAAHFKDTIETGNEVQYRGDIDWRLQ